MPWRKSHARNVRFTPFQAVSIRGPSLWVVVTLFLVIQCNSAMGQPQIYLANTGTYPWDGSCTDQNCPNLQNPCRFDATLYDANSLASCNVVVAGGDYNDATLNIAVAETVSFSMKLGRIQNLHIKVTGNKTIHFLPIDTVSALISSSVEVGYYGPLLGSSDIFFSNLHLEETSVYVLSGYALEIDDVNLTWSTNVRASPIRFAPSYANPTLVSSRSNFFVSGAPLLDTTSLSRVTIGQCTLDIDYLALLTLPSSPQIYILDDSVVTYRTPVLLDSTSVLEHPNDQFSFKQSRLTYSPSIPSPNNVLGSISRYPFETMQFEFSSISNTQIVSSVKTTLIGSQMMNCDIPGVHAFDCTNSNFVISAPHSNLYINSSEGALLSLDGLDVYVSESEASRKPFRIATSNPAMETASISTNKLWIGANLIIKRLSVNESIESFSAAQRNPTLGAPESGPSAWHFQSVAVFAVSINVSIVDRLEYTITYPDKGFLYPAPGEVSIPAVSLGDASGRKLFVKLAQYVSIDTGIWYPVLSNFTGSIGIEFSPDMYLDPSLYTMETRITGRAVSQVLQFRRMPIGLPPTSENRVCPTPLPTGFQCIDGVIVAVGNIDIPVIDFPPGSGVIIIIGNISSSSPISFSDTNSFLNVSGCIDIPGIEINLEGVKDPSTVLPSGSIVLASQGSECPKSLQNIPLSVKQNNKSCKKVKAKVDPQSTGSVVSVLFTVDNSDCNVKWIILGSVLGAVVVILVILVLIFTLNKRARTCIRPFSARKPGDS